jgi:glycosyltransferase involved in cell wall biosynthesis
VIIIFLNAERFLREAIESVRSQTYANWELLLVDDGSTDPSTEMARRLAAEFPERVRYLEHGGHQNRGMSAARNLGLRHARGSYVAFLDSDDVWVPHKLEEQVAVLEDHPEAGMVYGRTLFWTSWSQAPRRHGDSLSDLSVPPDTLISPPTLLTRNYPLVGDKTPSTSGLILRRQAIESVGGFEEEFRGLYEDQAFLAKIYLTTSVFVADRLWDKYRQHEDSCVSVAEREGRSHLARAQFLRWLEGLLKREGVRDRAIWRAVRVALWPYRHPLLWAMTTGARRAAREAAWLWLRLRVGGRRAFSRLLRRRVGLIGAVWREPPTEPEELGSMTLTWRSRQTAFVEVRVDSADGPLFTRGGPSGEATTGLWVRDRMLFYLQDVSKGPVHAKWNTLAVARVRVPGRRSVARRVAMKPGL